MGLGEPRLVGPKAQNPTAQIVGSTHGEVGLTGYRGVSPVLANQPAHLFPKVVMQALRPFYLTCYSSEPISMGQHCGPLKTSASRCGASASAIRSLTETIRQDGEGALFFGTKTNAFECVRPDIPPMLVMAGIEHGQGGPPPPNGAFNLSTIHSTFERKGSESCQRRGHPRLRPGTTGTGGFRFGQLPQPQKTDVQIGAPVGRPPGGLVANRKPTRDVAAVGLIPGQYQVELPRQIEVAGPAQAAESVVPLDMITSHRLHGLVEGQPGGDLQGIR